MAIPGRAWRLLLFRRLSPRLLPVLFRVFLPMLLREPLPVPRESLPVPRVKVHFWPFLHFHPPPDPGESSFLAVFALSPSNFQSRQRRPPEPILCVRPKAAPPPSRPFRCPGRLSRRPCPLSGRPCRPPFPPSRYRSCSNRSAWPPRKTALHKRMNARARRCSVCSCGNRLGRGPA